MPTLTIEERILVSAPPAKVWAFLLDPARVAPCLPGAKLDGTEGDKTFLGTMKVKVGPVTMDFKGKATMTEIHEEERRVVMVGTGNDKGGSGSAKMSMESRILAVEGKGSEIVVTAEVDLAGKLMSFGRGMMTGISRQLFKQFSERVRAELETEDEEQEESAAEQAAPVEEARKAEEKAVEEPKNEEAPAAEARKEEAIAVEEPKKEEAAVEEVKKDEAPPAEAEKTEAAAEEPKKEEAVAEEAKAEAPKVAAPAKEAPPAAPKAKKKPSAALAPADNAPLSAGGLIWAALWEWVKDLFRRVFGKR